MSKNYSWESSLSYLLHLVTSPLLGMLVGRLNEQKRKPWTDRNVFVTASSRVEGGDHRWSEVIWDPKKFLPQEEPISTSITHKSYRIPTGLKLATKPFLALCRQVTSSTAEAPVSMPHMSTKGSWNVGAPVNTLPGGRCSIRWWARWRWLSGWQAVVVAVPPIIAFQFKIETWKVCHMGFLERTACPTMGMLRSGPIPLLPTQLSCKIPVAWRSHVEFECFLCLQMTMAFGVRGVQHCSTSGNKLNSEWLRYKDVKHGYQIYCAYCSFSSSCWVHWLREFWLQGSAQISQHIFLLGGHRW